jgi:hypothetical protein
VADPRGRHNFRSVGSHSPSSTTGPRESELVGPEVKMLVRAGQLDRYTNTAELFQDAASGSAPKDRTVGCVGVASGGYDVHSKKNWQFGTFVGIAAPENSPRRG